MEVVVGGIYSHGTRDNSSELVGQDTERVDGIQNLDNSLDNFPEWDILWFKTHVH